jgi:hypothetical protein
MHYMHAAFLPFTFYPSPFTFHLLPFTFVLFQSMKKQNILFTFDVFCRVGGGGGVALEKDGHERDDQA